MKEGLPQWCFAVLGTTKEIVTVRIAEKGYYKYCHGEYSGQELADQLNEDLKVTKPQARAMFYGSVFGWESQLADPSMYNEDGSHKDAPPKETVQHEQAQ